MLVHARARACTSTLLHARAHRGCALLKHRGRDKNWRLRQCGAYYRKWYQADRYFVEISVRFLFFILTLFILFFDSSSSFCKDIYNTGVPQGNDQDCSNIAVLASKNGLHLFQEEEFLQIMMHYTWVCAVSEGLYEVTLFWLAPCCQNTTWDQEPNWNK